ncbi:MAG: OadG family transporter subunit [Caldisericia bacterium]|nr:OadG family transporter subunit [Caldisericia bacterium]
MMYEGVSIMLSGMGTVFLFLILLIATVAGMSAFVLQMEKRSKKDINTSLHNSHIAALAAIVLHLKEGEVES